MTKTRSRKSFRKSPFWTKKSMKRKSKWQFLRTSTTYQFRKEIIYRYSASDERIAQEKNPLKWLISSRWVISIKSCVATGRKSLLCKNIIQEKKQNHSSFNSEMIIESLLPLEWLLMSFEFLCCLLIKINGSSLKTDELSRQDITGPCINVI